jgi:hypothetical protein
MPEPFASRPARISFPPVSDAQDLPLEAREVRKSTRKGCQCKPREYRVTGAPHQFAALAAGAPARVGTQWPISGPVSCARSGSARDRSTAFRRS